MSAILHDGRGEVDVARREDDLRALADQLVGARLRGRRVVLLRVAGLEHDLAAHDALLVDLLDARACAAASAGPSNGPIGPLESWAQPMMIGSFAAAECVRAAAAAAKTSAAAATITSAQRARLLALMFLLSGPRLPPGPSFSTRPGRRRSVRGARARRRRDPRASRDTRCRRRRCRRRSRGRRSPFQPTSSKTPRIAGRSAAPSPGRTRSAQPRVGSRQSLTCTPAMRCA